MTRKRLRYSELGTPPDASATETPVPPVPPVPESIGPTPATRPERQPADVFPDLGGPLDALVVERDDDAPLIDVLPGRSAMIEPFVQAFGTGGQVANDDLTVGSGDATVAPTRPRRNSTPVELARTLTAARVAARAQEGGAAGHARARDVVVRDTSADRSRRTLRERARSRSGLSELLMFYVGGERFAVELILVDEVIDLPVVHHVPEMPPAMLGVVTVRGSLTPVYSPHHALGRPLAMRNALLIFRRGAYRVGILIDDVDDALSADLAELRERPASEEGDNVLLGVIRLANTLVGIVDADALITSCQSANILEPA